MYPVNPSACAQPRARSGFTLIELLVIGLLAAIVLGSVTATLVRQQRFYRGVADIIETRSQIRQATGIIPLDLRGISTAGGDLISISDTAMLFRATIGSSVVCALVAPNTIIVPPPVLASGNTLTAWVVPPVPGDTAFIYDNAATSAATDDSWKAYKLTTGVDPVIGGCPATTGLTTAADATTASYAFSTDDAVAGTVLVGAPVRFVRTSRLSLYRASDDNSYLGYCAPACGADGPQAIAGPFLPYSGLGNAGVSFTYAAETGAVTAVPSEVAQISILVRGQTKTPANTPGLTQEIVGDSLRLTVAIRNRK